MIPTERVPPQYAEECPKRDPVSIQILRQFTDLGVLADDVAKRTRSKLHSVMRSVPPPPALEKTKICPDQYPPFFEELRALADQIQHTLNDINEALDRTEL
jgi:hypothetical protein